jgi:hypothetical protein
LEKERERQRGVKKRKLERKRSEKYTTRRKRNLEVGKEVRLIERILVEIE